MKLRDGKKYAIKAGTAAIIPRSEYVSRHRKLITNVQMSQTLPNNDLDADGRSLSLETTRETITKTKQPPTNYISNTKVNLTNVSSVRSSQNEIVRQDSNIKKEVTIIKKKVIISSSTSAAASTASQENLFEAKHGLRQSNNITTGYSRPIQIDNNKEPKSLLKKRRRRRTR